MKSRASTSIILIDDKAVVFGEIATTLVLGEAWGPSSPFVGNAGVDPRVRVFPFVV